MHQQFFNISFIYNIEPESLQIHLTADVEMIDDITCSISDIRRQMIAEPPLMPLFKLKKAHGKWVHSDSDKETNLSKAIDDAIKKHLAQPYPDLKKVQ